MEGSSGADSAPSLSSWSISPDATVLSPDLRPGCWGNVLPLRGNEFDLKPRESAISILTSRRTTRSNGGTSNGNSSEVRDEVGQLTWGTLTNLRPRQGGKMRDGAALRRIVHVVPVVIVRRLWWTRTGCLRVWSVIQRRSMPPGQRAKLTLPLSSCSAVTLTAVSGVVPQRRCSCRRNTS